MNISKIRSWFSASGQQGAAAHKYSLLDSSLLSPARVYRAAIQARPWILVAFVVSLVVVGFFYLRKVHRREKETLNKQIQDLQTDNENLQHKLQELQEEKVKTTPPTLQKLELEKEEINQQVIDSKHRTQSFQPQNEKEYQEALHELREKRKKANQQIASLQSQVITLHKQYDQKIESISKEKEEALAVANQAVKLLASHVQGLRDQIQAFEQKTSGNSRPPS